MSDTIIEITEGELTSQQTIDAEPRYYWDAEYRLLMDQAAEESTDG